MFLFCLYCYSFMESACVFITMVCEGWTETTETLQHSVHVFSRKGYLYRCSGVSVPIHSLTPYVDFLP